jgi:hypothetical protein
MSVESNDPNPDHCGICFALYERTTTITLNDRLPSSTCRHAMCIGCAIQHAVAFDRTICPFCRAPEAYGADDFRGLLPAENPSDFSSVTATTTDGVIAVAPQVLELLLDAKLKRETTRMHDMIRHIALMMGGHDIDDDAIVSVSEGLDNDGDVVFSFELYTPAVSNDAAAIESAVATDTSS